MEKTLVLAGATGLIGSELLKILLDDPYYSKVIILVRRESNLVHPKLVQQVINFDEITTLGLPVSLDDAFCTLGTTMKNAGSKEAFRKVDESYVVEFANFALRHGAKRFFTVSSMGANPVSMIFYSKVKGQVEQKISALPFNSVHIFRPSMLMGKRIEKRPGEEFALKAYSFINPLLPAKYKGIEATRVAMAMLNIAKENSSGINIYQSDKIREVSG